jgi:uncharacterized Rossmann fold enzyme
MKRIYLVSWNSTTEFVGFADPDRANNFADDLGHQYGDVEVTVVPFTEKFPTDYGIGN